MSFLVLGASIAHADIDLSEYQTSQAVRSTAEQEVLQRDFARQRQAEHERQTQERAAELRRLAEEQARLAARPWSEQLTEARCATCHATSSYESVNHVLPGWFVVILRMRLLNGAPIAWEEMLVISQYLVTRRSTGPVIAFVEWSLFGAVVIAAGLVARAIFRRFLSLRRSQKS